MAAPYLVPNLATLRAEIDARWPKRAKRSDGWIGDRAHQSSPSGHNPDETGNAERQDADNKDEVRALDLDKDIDPAPGDELYTELDRIRRTPALRRRLIYIIYRGRICSASNGWVWRTYTGSNPHTEHGHLSGHPDHDDNAAPWGIAGEDDMSPEELKRADIWTNPYGDARTNPTITLDTYLKNIGAGVVAALGEAKAARGDVANLRAEVKALAQRPTTSVSELDYDELARALLRVAARGPAS